jgi:hypothetical protein
MAMFLEKSGKMVGSIDFLLRADTRIWNMNTTIGKIESVPQKP